MGQHAELAAPDHGGGEVHHLGVRLEVQVAEHFVGSPATDEFDYVGIDVATQECHGAARPEGAGRNC